MGSVDRLLYRQLLRQGRAHDRIPAFKALLANQRTRVYCREESRWTELEHSSELAAEELRSHATQLFGSGTNCVRLLPLRVLLSTVLRAVRLSGWAMTHATVLRTSCRRVCGMPLAALLLSSCAMASAMISSLVARLGPPSLPVAQAVKVGSRSGVMWHSLP